MEDFREKVRTVTCSYCGAGPGKPCLDKRGRPYADNHSLRLKRWEKEREREGSI